MVSVSTLTWWLTHLIALCGVAPLLVWLGAAPRLALAAGLLASIWQMRTSPWRLKNWILNLAMLPPFLIYLAQYRANNAVQPVVTLLAFMLALRLVSEKNVRHHLQIHVLALFCLAASSLFDLRPTFLLFLGLILLLEAPALVLLTYHDIDPDMRLRRQQLRPVLAAGVVLLLLTLPLLLLFFPLLPRTQLPLWNLVGAPLAASTGFSDRVEPGKTANQGEVREPVFRAEMERLAPDRCYWRVTRFNQFDGRRWSRSTMGMVEPPTLVPASPAVKQTIYLQPVSMPYLPALDRPLSISSNAVQRAPDGVFERSRRRGGRLVYTALSDLSGVTPLLSLARRASYTELPAHFSPRLKALAATLKQQGDSEEQLVGRLDSYFRTGGYRYSNQGMPTGEQALEQFLFSGKQGNCEFFASAYALLLRSMGVPARLVGGYLGGEYNQLGGYYLVSEDRAHVWVEAYLAGQGWRRIDPSMFANNAGQLLGSARSVSRLMQLRLVADAFEYYWNRTVVNYDFERQVEVAHGISQRLQRFEFTYLLQRWRLLLFPVLLLAIVTLLWQWRSLLLESREQRLLRRYYHRLEKECGLTVEPGKQGVFELAAASRSQVAEEFALIYGAAVYHGRRLDDQEYRQLRALCRQPFKPAAER